MEIETAKLFSNGGSQAVRLPKKFRFEGEQVLVRRCGRGVLLEPIDVQLWPEEYWASMPLLEEHQWTRPSDTIPPPIEHERESP